MSAKLLTVVSSKQFLISTNGEHFGHPDDVALARAVTAGGPGTTLWFNYPATAKTRRWADRALTERYELTTRFADSDAAARLDPAPRRRARHPKQASSDAKQLL